MTTLRSLTLGLALVLALASGCATRTSSPAARATAVQLFASGKSCDEIAASLQVDREHARELVRTGMADLSRKFYRAR